MDGVFPGRPHSFRHQRRPVDAAAQDEEKWHRTAEQGAAQDEEEWRRTAEQGTEHFMAKWIVAERAKAGLRHSVACLNVTGRTKERIAQSKRARAGSLALVDKPQVARTCILQTFGLQMMSCCLSLVLRLVCLLCFASFFVIISLKPRPFVQPPFDMQAPR